jgi:7-alpha-hydroxysteroid dehydrogenase
MPLLDRFRLDNRVALITAASRGIGRGIALGFAEAGAKVMVSARNETKLAELVDEIEGAGGVARAHRCDVTDREQLEQLVAATADVFGQLDVLVNNAGGSMPALIANTSQETFEQSLHFNVGAAFELTRLALPRLLESKGAAVVNISSAMAHVVESGFVSYGTAKAALSHMSRLMARELAPRVRVNALEVGATQTDALSLITANPEWKQAMIDETPMGRLGDVEDIAAAALYLASDAGSWVTGKVFEIDGGTDTSVFPLTMKAL